MEAELIKEGNFYKLIQNNTILAKISTNESIDIHYSFGKLSLKNCQAVANGYDLDELSDENTSDCDASGCYPEDVFKDGFKKALEIIGDKKFCLDQLITAMDKARVMIDGKHAHSGEEIFQSLQQTEWDVIVEMEKVKDETKIIGSVKGVKGSGDKITTYKSIPKLDADGCLILKRKI